MFIYNTRALTGLRLSHPEFINCFVFALFKNDGPSTYTTTPTFYIFSASQNATPIISALINLPVGTLYRTVLTGGDLPNHSFQSDVNIQSFSGFYDLRQTGSTGSAGVHVGLRWSGRRRPPINPQPVSGWGQLLDTFQRWLQFRQSDESYNDMRVNVDSGDIGNATSLSGWITRFDNPPPWMIDKVQAGV